MFSERFLPAETTFGFSVSNEMTAFKMTELFLRLTIKMSVVVAIYIVMHNLEDIYFCLDKIT